MRTELHCLLWGLFTLCQPTIAYTGSAAETVEVGALYAWAVPPGQTNSAAFVTLRNNSDRDYALVAAESPMAKALELHTHIMEGEMMRMRPVEKIEIPAGAKVELQPGGLHIMLIGLEHQLTPGEAVQITLIYADGSKQTLQASVRKVQPVTHHHH
jgi:copper(I)-binding protein